MKDRLTELRASLPEEDRTLLILRVDRELSWTDVADIMLGNEDRTKGTARLRKRFERLVVRLRDHLASVSGDEP